MAAVTSVFEKWKEFLKDRVDQAEQMGMSDEVISKLAYHIGDFLADKVDPKNSEERILKDLWEAGTEEEQKTLAKLMVKLVNE